MTVFILTITDSWKSSYSSLKTGDDNYVGFSPILSRSILSFLKLNNSDNNVLLKYKH